MENEMKALAEGLALFLNPDITLSGIFKDGFSLFKFADRFYHFEVKDSSKIKIDPDSYKYDKSFKGEFIRTVNADESLDDDKKEKIIACGLYALMGENIFDS